MLGQIDIIAVGEPNELIKPTVEGYERLLSKFVQLRVAQIPGKPATPVRGVEISEEARRVAATVEAIEAERGGPVPILLCDNYGDPLTTQEFAQHFLPMPYLCVIVGGIYGLNEAMEGREMRRVSFGRVTLSSSIARVVVADQLYRALLSARNLPYDLQ